MIHAQYLNDIRLQPIGDNERCLGDDQLARAGDATGRPIFGLFGRNCSMLCKMLSANARAAAGLSSAI